MLQKGFPMWWDRLLLPRLSSGAMLVVFVVMVGAHALLGMSAVNFVVGLVLLSLGAEWVTAAACFISKRLKIPTVLVGLTIVALGTSLPEALVSCLAASRGAGELALGNVVGSNIANPLLVMGLAATIAALKVPSKVVRLDMGAVIFTSLIVLILSATGARLSPFEGAFLLAYLGYFVWSRFKAVGSADEVTEDDLPLLGGGWSLNVACLLLGVLMLQFGAALLVDAATGWALQLGWSEALVGLTIVAIGTSVPELAVCIKAALRGQTGLIVGNVLGSNIMNNLFVLGAAALAGSAYGGLQVAPVNVVDFAVMMAVALFCLPLMISRRHLDPWEGYVLLGVYALYLGVRMGLESDLGVGALMGVPVLIFGLLAGSGLLLSEARKRKEEL